MASFKIEKARLLPQDGNTCGWYNVLPTPPPPRRLQMDVQADWTVVGGGFTGLACARRLAELHPNARIVLIEAQRIGQGNSGRNSGWLLNFNSFGGEPVELGRANARLQKAGLQHLSDVVTEHGINCDWTPWGTLCFTLAGKEVPHLEQLKANCRAANEPYEEWSADKVRELCGVKRASKAFFQPGTVLVNPAALVRGLAEALPQNVDLYEDTPLRFIRKDAAYTIGTPDGAITSNNVMLCINGFTPELLGKYNQVAPIAAYAVMTRQLTTQELALLGSGDPYSFISPIEGDSLFRRTHDGRLMCRQNWIRYLPGMRFSQEDYDNTQKYAREAIKLRWPELENVEFEHIWGGVLPITKNGGHTFGKIDDGLYVTSFCNGAHNTKGTMTGRLLADYAAGIDSPLLADQLKIPAPKRLPPRPFIRLGAELQIRKMMRTQKAAYRAIS